ncbi:MAG: hypothetical protein ACRCZ0_07280 [Cetobacterium sp.]
MIKPLVCTVVFTVMYLIEKTRQMIAFNLTSLHMTRSDMLILDIFTKVEILLFVVIITLLIKYIGGNKDEK